MTRSALEGIRVIDWTVYHQGPSAGMILAELGADVIHIEQPGQGDLMRGASVMMGVPLALPGGRHIAIEDLNKNKRSLTLDLRKPAGRDLMYRLVEKSDIFLTNLRVKAVARLGMDYQTLSRLNPRLIYAHATTFGDHGPEKDSPGLEPLAFGRSGAMLASGEVGGPPVYLALGSGDRIGGIFLALGMLTALFVRERTGVGQEVSTSQLGGMINLNAIAVMITMLTGIAPRPTPRRRFYNPLANYYRCQDGQWIILGMFSQHKSYWPSFCHALERPDLVDDPRFDDDAKRAKNCEELVAVLDAVFATRPREEWERRLRAEDDLLFSRVNSLEDLAGDPQILANNYLVDFDHPALGPIKQVALPITFSETPARIHSPAPELGEHTEEILTEVLGVPWEQIAELRDQGVI